MTVSILHSLRREFTCLLTCGRRSLVSENKNDLVVSWLTLWGMIKVYWLDLTWPPECINMGNDGSSFIDCEGQSSQDSAHKTPTTFKERGQSSGAVWKSRWPSWVPVPNKPTVSVDVKQHSTKESGKPKRGIKPTLPAYGPNCLPLDSSKHWAGRQHNSSKSR